MNRRKLLQSLPACAALPTRIASARPAQGASTRERLALVDYQPKSMLVTPVTNVPKARFPVIDFHTHISFGGELKGGDQIKFNCTPEQALSVMDRTNIRTMVNLTGGYGPALQKAIARFQTPHPERFVVFTEPYWSKADSAGYPQFQADQIDVAYKAGAKGIKLLKTLGLYLREHVTSGKLVAVDDPRFDPMWEAAAAHNMPIAMHTSDPLAFFLATDRYNERYEELSAHPDWSFHGKDFPSNRELQEARRRVMKRHPKTHFVCLHVAEAEDLGYVSECLDAHPNMSVDIAARIGELGRQPRAAAKFFDRYQDRIVFGTDATPNGTETPQQLFGEDLYRIYYRFLETEDEYFDYAPAPVPPQGRWRIYGVGLSEQILRKVYFENAARSLGMNLQSFA